ncbi:hypothetical protein EWM64_g4495 [Hericium alpestre]|uniref:Cytochrome P450 n=1 Tax=Hericium alpestre TaxID=135208 RepID=A0A4Y9ZZY8_9AGAM|nr:hypothetical protein EWM64_g4495 [Hericium alpestre]
MAPVLLFLGFVSVILVLRYVLMRLIRPSTVRDLRGPPSPSFWIGRSRISRYQSQIGDVEFKWMRDYGSVWRTTGPLWLVQKWREELIGNGTISSGATINVALWLSWAFLDTIAAAGFNYDVDAVDDVSTELHQQYASLFIDSTLYPCKLDTVFKLFWRYIPVDILHLVRFLPSREYIRFHNYTQFMRKFAMEMIRKNESVGSKDILNVLQQANASADNKTKLSVVEV